MTDPSPTIAIGTDATNQGPTENRPGLLELGADIDQLDPVLDESWLAELKAKVSTRTSWRCFYPRVASFLRQLIGDNLDISVVSPVPLIGDEQPDQAVKFAHDSFEMPRETKFIDTGGIKIIQHPGNPVLEFGSNGFSGAQWAGDPINLDFRKDAFCLTTGFHRASGNGALAVAANCVISLPYRISGLLHFRLRVRAASLLGASDILVRMGDHTQKFSAVHDGNTVNWGLRLDQACDTLAFEFGEPLTWTGENAIAIESVDIVSKDCHPEVTVRTLPGNENSVVFCSRLSRDFDADNWHDLVTAFCSTFRSHNDCTLLILVESIGEFAPEFITRLRMIGDISCRIIIVEHSSPFIPRTLVADCDFYVSASAAAHTLVDIQQAALNNTPVIAPAINGLESFVGSQCGYPVNTSRRPEFVSQVRRQAFSAFEYSLDWESLSSAMKQAYQLRSGADQTTYQAFCQQSARFMADSISAHQAHQTHGPQTGTKSVTQ